MTREYPSDPNPGYVTAPAPQKALGDRYTIENEIGRGGMATVYRARQSTVDRDVAIKMIQGGLSDPAAIQRFTREARLVARLEHPHILPVYDFDGAHDPPYIVMRYLDGGTLDTAALAWAKAAGFKAEAGALLLIPNGSGEIGSAFYGLGGEPYEAPFISGKLSKLLPPGDWRIESSALTPEFDRSASTFTTVRSIFCSIRGLRAVIFTSSILLLFLINRNVTGVARFLLSTSKNCFL